MTPGGAGGEVEGGADGAVMGGSVVGRGAGVGAGGAVSVVFCCAAAPDETAMTRHNINNPREWRDKKSKNMNVGKNSKKRIYVKYRNGS